MKNKAFTLVELLVVIAIIGMLVGILLPAVQSARESGRRVQCANNLRQLGIAAQSYESTFSTFPPGAVAKEYPAKKTNPYNYYRWSALAHLLPHLENGNIYDRLHLDVPLYDGFRVSEVNRQTVSLRISEFLCPSDSGTSENITFGPTNYAACAGSGVNGGSPYEADGMFFTNSNLPAAAIKDGKSNTLAFSESILGRTPPPVTFREDANPRLVYGYARAIPLNEEACGRTALWNFTEARGFSWANGEYRSALFNTYLSPNSPEFDCITARISGPLDIVHSGYGWKTARSWHPGGVNACFADGSLKVITNDIENEIWRRYGTVSGGEIVP